MCRRWYEIARLTWSQKETLILNTRHIFEDYSYKKDNQYGFVCRPGKKKDIKKFKNKLISFKTLVKRRCFKY